MECIKDFLQNNYQVKLRKFAQGLSERHEDTIESYKKLFIIHYNYVKDENEKCNSCSMLNRCKQVRNTVNNIAEKDINEFFDCIKDVYLDWINANPVEAINQFETILNNYQLLDCEKNIDKEQIYFKSRNSNVIEPDKAAEVFDTEHFTEIGNQPGIDCAFESEELHGFLIENQFCFTFMVDVGIP